MAISINDSGQVGAPLAFLGKEHLDPKTSVKYITDLESLNDYLPNYSMVIVEDGDEAGTIWQYQPDGTFLQLNITGGGAYLDDVAISDESTFSSSKIDSTYAKSANVYTKTESDTSFGTLAQQESNTAQLAQLDAKVNGLSSAIIYKGNVATYGELLLLEDVNAGSLYIVDADESLGYDPFPSTKYIYSDDNQWIFNGVQEVSMRDFTTQPINLGSTDENGIHHTEVTGTLSLSNIDFTDFDSEDVSYENEGYPTITSVKDALDQLLYTPLSITFSTTASTTLESGQSVSNPVFNWKYSKTIAQQTFNGTILDNTLTTYTLNTTLTSNTTITLVANDGAKDTSKSIQFSWYDAIYSGYALATDTYDSDFVLGLQNKKLSGSCFGDYTLTCPDDNYIYFAIPSNIATTSMSFWSGGFCGGVDIVAENISIENNYNATADYNIYRTTNGSLGATTITIKK